MYVDGVAMRTIWPIGQRAIGIIDQTRLPHALVTVEINSPAGTADAIKTMRVRGAPLIGATAAYGVALAMNQDPSDAALAAAVEMLMTTRPTAINLRWGLQRCRRVLEAIKLPERAQAAWRLAGEICEEDVATNQAIGRHGMGLLKAARKENKPVNILTHCNAGWLAAVDVGMATAPIYAAHDAGIAVHVWVDETRPRNRERV